MSNAKEVDIKKSVRKILDKTDNVANFLCGNKDIDDFIRNESLDYQNERLGTTYLFKYDNELFGFVTLSMADLRKGKMESEDRLSIGKEQYPALLIGQLAVCKNHQGEDLGIYLCDFCFDRALKFSEKIGCRFLILNAQEAVIGFYEKYGFKLIPKQKNRREKLMFLNIIPSPENQ